MSKAMSNLQAVASTRTYIRPRVVSFKNNILELGLNPISYDLKLFIFKANFDKKVRLTKKLFDESSGVSNSHFTLVILYRNHLFLLTFDEFLKITLIHN